MLSKNLYAGNIYTLDIGKLRLFLLLDSFTKSETYIDDQSSWSNGNNLDPTKVEGIKS